MLSNLLDVISKERKSGDLNKHTPPEFHTHYESWYSEAHALIKQLLPDRLSDFERLYKREKRREVTAENYCLSDYLVGLSVSHGWKPVFNITEVAYMKLNQQYAILKAADGRFESSLFDIKQLLQAEVFDSEIDAARELLKKGFIRAAGAVSGVVLEKHLSVVCEKHNNPVKKKKPTISDYNDKLKEHEVIDIPTWRFIQRLGDLRNLCDHDKKREPKKEEITDLIDGTEKITKAMF